MEKHTNKTITKERNNMGMVRYCVVDREHIPNSHCGGSFLSKKEGIEQLQRAKRLYPDHSWTLEVMYIIGDRERATKSLGDPLNESYEDLEDMPEYRPQGDKYYKYGVKGHTYKPDRYDYRTKKWDWGGVEYPYEEFDNIEDALKCYERFRKMENSVPQNVRIMGYYKTLGDDDWEYVNPNNIKESKNMNKIRLSETQLREVIKESVNKVLNEQSYRKSAKKGEHTSSALKHELKLSKEKGHI